MKRARLAVRRPGPLWVLRSALPAALALLAMINTAAAEPLTATDSAGRTISLQAPARRVVALAPNLTELVYAAGGGPRLVGVGRYSDWPPEALKLPVMGDAFALNLETIAKARPDLVLVWGSGTNERQKAQLRAQALSVFEIEIGRVDDIAATLRTLGRLMGTGAVAEPAAARIDAEWRDLRTAYTGRAPLRVFYQLWQQPLMTVNAAHGISEAIRACGGVNVFAGQPTLTPTVSWEAAVKADPQVIVSAASRDETPAFDFWRQFKQVSAVRTQRFVQLDGQLIGRMGPRFVAGARELCQALDAAR